MVNKVGQSNKIMGLLGQILSYPRSVMVTSWFIFHTMICAIFVLIVTPLIPQRAFADFVIRTLWASPVLFFSGIDVEVRGLSHWPEGNLGLLVLFNHASWMDILVLCGKLPKVPRFGAKIELFSIPFFGSAMRRVGMLPIERRHRTKVLKIYKDAELRAAQGECFALAPEGTRQSQLSLGKFKQGPFLFAVRAHLPIVPLVLAGTRETMPKSAWWINKGQWRRKVIMEILPCLSLQGKTEADISHLQEAVVSAMGPRLETLHRELGLL